MTEQIKPCCSASRSTKQQSVTAAPEKTKPSPAATEEMVYIPGGDFFMGTNDKEGFPADGEGPTRKVNMDAFYIDPCTVTNAQFKVFVDATGYETEAEKFTWSFVFHLFVSPQVAETVRQAPQQTPWWWVVDGAYWYQPEGPDSCIKDRMDHPVVHVSWNDAVAFCKWAGKRLPKEAEWEYAARGGLEQKRYPWGDVLKPKGEHYCNIWQGKFPTKNHAVDGYTGTAPAKSYVPNGFGLYNVAGNVWEWCSDWFSRDYHLQRSSTNPVEPHEGTSKSMRGGSYLCHKSYCNRYRVAARSSNTPDSSSGNIGFRCVADA